MKWQSVVYKYNPAVPNRWLLLIAGCAWSIAGTFLCFRAFDWIDTMPDSSAIVIATSGTVVAVAASRFMFGNIARRNVGRIGSLPERACIFAFTAWRGYAMIAVMVVLGIALRTSSVPKQYLAPLYIAMGGSLMLSSVVFFRNFWRNS